MIRTKISFSSEGALLFLLAQQGRWNVIFVNWRGGGDLPLYYYFDAASNTRLVGAVVAQWILMLSTQLSYSPSRMHCLGHSLGAHICGYAGKHLLTTGHQLARITGTYR